MLAGYTAFSCEARNGGEKTCFEVRNTEGLHAALTSSYLVVSNEPQWLEALIFTIVTCRLESATTLVDDLAVSKCCLASA